MHAIVENTTGLVVEPLFLLDEEARPVCTVVAKGTFQIRPEGSCVLAEKQSPVLLEPIFRGDPETTSLELDTETQFFKPTTDIVVLGTARSSRPVKELLVAIRVGPLQKGILVVGDRVWVSAMGAVAATQPLPFTEVPLEYERAFGGWDCDHPDPEKHALETRNPVGVSFRSAGGFKDGIRLPNLENPIDRIGSFGQRVTPAGCGYVGPHWQPRAALAGTYDEAWQEKRAPRLPTDYDVRHQNAAAPGLVAAAYLRGDEPFTLANVGFRGGLKGVLPAMPPPSVKVRRVQVEGAEDLRMHLDTVIFLADREEVQLIWRGTTILKRGPHDVAAIEAGVIPKPMALSGLDNMGDESEDEE